MRTEKQIKKMLEGYTVGRPRSRRRVFLGLELLLFCEYGYTLVYAYDGNSQLYAKKFYNWFQAFNYYYNTLENIISTNLKQGV
jgi:hypothetical protein